MTLDFISQVIAAIGIMVWIGFIWLLVMWFIRGASEASETLKDRENK